MRTCSFSERIPSGLWCWQLTASWKNKIVNKKQIQRNDRQRVNTNGGNQSIKKIVKQILDSKDELKFKLTTFSSGVDTTMQATDLSSIPNGNTSSSRIGATIQAKRLRIKWVAGAGDTTNLIRFSIVYWKPNDAVDVPQASEVYQTSGCLAPILNINPSRFKLMVDKLVFFDTYHPIRSGEMDLRLGEYISYVPGLDTGMNHLYLLVQSDSGGVPNPSFEFSASLDYVDA